MVIQCLELEGAAVLLVTFPAQVGVIREGDDGAFLDRGFEHAIGLEDDQGFVLVTVAGRGDGRDLDVGRRIARAGEHRFVKQHRLVVLAFL